MTGWDWLWLLTDAGLFVGALVMMVRDMRRIRWAPELVRRTFATAGWYGLAVVSLMAVVFMVSGYTLAGAVIIGVVAGGLHLVMMAPLVMLALAVRLPRLEQRAEPER